MTRELLNYDVRPSRPEVLDLVSVGSHDDLVTALGLAVLEDDGDSGLGIRIVEGGPRWL